MKSKIQFAKLTRLARYLERTKIPDFNFGDYSYCALAQCPKVFPKEWVANSWGSPRLSNPIGDTYSATEHSMEFFGITLKQSAMLFCPGKKLGSEATKSQVTKNIRAFIKSRQALTK